MNGKLNRGLKSFGEAIDYFIPGSEGSGVISSEHMDRMGIRG